MGLFGVVWRILRSFVESFGNILIIQFHFHNINLPNIIYIIQLNMIVKFANRLCFQQPFSYKFASAAAAAVDYYSLLGLQRDATRAEIEQAFKKITRNVSPDNNYALFSRLTEAFVILSDGRARDAYDSLQKVRKFSYINQPVTKPSVNSYIADRKAAKNKQFEKKYNIDKFGRYRGGLPNRHSQFRGNALGNIGQLHSVRDLVDIDTHPEQQKVDNEIAESFKNFHQDERVHRTAKRPWISFQIDYGFFTARRLFDQFPVNKIIFMVLFIFPITAFFNAILKKVLYKLDLSIKEQKRRKHEEKQAKKKQQEQKKLQEQQKLAEKQAEQNKIKEEAVVAAKTE